MAGQRDVEYGRGGKNDSLQQMLGLAGGVALGALAAFGAYWYMQKGSGSESKPKHVSMSPPPPRMGADTQHDSFASVAKESQPNAGKQRGEESRSQHDEKDGKQKAHPPQAETLPPVQNKAPAPSHDTKAPEPGFDAPEDKMADIGMSWRNNGGEITIEALCPKDLQPKDLKCHFTTNTLQLEVAGKQIATGKLSGRIKPDECTWQFGDEHLKNESTDSKSLTVTLVKSDSKPWKELFQVAGPAGLE